MPIRIRSLKTSAGYLKNAPIEFSDGLNCIIGARGTCKSTIVETIRFAFDCDPDKVNRLLHGEAGGSATAEAPSSAGLIGATLKDGLARCEIVQHDGTGDSHLSVERDVDSVPRVYREGIKELSDASLLHSIEIYSQGDLQRIAECDDLRLELIDRPNKVAVANLRQERDTHTKRLRDLGKMIRVKRQEIEARQSELHGLDAMRTQLDEVRSGRPSLSKELDEEHQGYLRRKTLIEHFQLLLQRRRAVLDGLRATLGEGTPGARGLDKEAVEASISDGQALIDGLMGFDALLSKLRSDLDAADRENLDSLLPAVTQTIEGKNAKYYKLRQEQQAVNESLKKEETLKKQVTYLEKLQADLDRLLGEMGKLVEERKVCRRRIQHLNDQIYQLRLQQVEQINGCHGDVILLTLEQGAQSSHYAAVLSELLQGSRLRNQDDVTRDLTEKTRPSDLVDIVESGDSQRLASLLGRDLGQMARLVSFLMDHAKLYELEGAPFEDKLEITFYDGEVPKPVNQLSRGQMATALLPLILRPAEYPLVFDQPEDDLDNRFIFMTLVERIRQLKVDRQLIFVTHNANIPVLGDADKIIVMQMENPTSARPPITGSVDEAKAHILTLLEGGADAFKKRHLRYIDLLTGE
jgi:DNA repair ATPase RecN